MYTEYMITMSTSGGGRLEKLASYSRAKRVGPFVFIAGTTSMQSDGKLFAPNDTYEQTVHIFAKMEKYLNSVGAEMSHVVRTRAYLTDLRDAGGFITAHGEAFKGIEPVLTGVQAGLTTPGMMVEVEFDAIINSDEDDDFRTAGDARPVKKEYSAEFKSAVALEAIRGELSLHDLAVKFDVHPNLVTLWKRQVSDSMATLFTD